MTPRQALENLNKLALNYQGTRQEHAILERSVSVLEVTIMGAEALSQVEVARHAASEPKLDENKTALDPNLATTPKTAPEPPKEPPAES